MEPANTRRKGKIKFMNIKSGYGFIHDIDTHEEFYFSISDIQLKEQDMQHINDIILTFELLTVKRGPKAVRIEVLNQQ